MKKSVRGKRLSAMLAALAITASLGACGTTSDDAVNSTQGTVATSAELTDKEPAREWETSIRLAITYENELVKDAGVDQASWEKSVAQKTQEGLERPISADELLAADKDATVLSVDERVYHIGPNSLFGPVNDALDAYRLAYRLVETLGGTSDTCLALASRLTKDDMTVYNFQQICDADEDLGYTLKIAVGKEGEVTGVFGCIDEEASTPQRLVGSKDAESVAASHCDGNEKVLSEFTERTFISPVTMAEALDLENEGDPVPKHLTWIVYSTNDEQSKDNQEYPYLAHYVKADGTWLYSLPVKAPGDDEARCGFRKQDVFDGMEADTYTCEVTDVAGKTKTVTVPVMHSKADNCWYLGDVERHVVVADFAEAAYGDHSIAPLKSEDNEDWDVEDVYTYHNYLRARDFYADMGWTGPDGQGTDEVIFSGLCYHNGTPFENACSIGLIEGWQAFGYAPYTTSGEPLRLGWGLDVMAHELTHTFTATVMGQNLYENDLGAINESMSDIMGNLVEYICADTNDTEWTLGENTGIVVRCMSDPAAHNQPTHVWDEHYGPKTNDPNEVNDRGGVHAKSSLLNLVAASLCLDDGMSYEDAVTLWTTVAMGITPRADYRQMPALLTWALKETGMDDTYQDALDELIDQTRMESADKPDPLPTGQKLVELELPNTEAFEDKNWALVCFQLDIHQLLKLIDDATTLITNAINEPDGLDKLADGLGTFLEDLHLEESELEGTKLNMSEGDESDDPMQQVFSQLVKLASKYVVVTQFASWEEMDTGTIPLITDEGKYSFYMLINISKGGSQINNVVLKLGDTWYDLMVLDAGEASQEEQLAEMSEALVEEVMRAVTQLSGFDPQESGADTHAQTTEHLPTTGLETIELSTEGLQFTMEDTR